MGLIKNTSENLKTFSVLTRAYSLPISIMSWFVPFLCAAFSGGIISYGFAALAGIVILHLASNLFDDIIDYTGELKRIREGKQAGINFQKGKCACILENKVTFKQACIIDFILFLTASAIGVFFLGIYGAELLFIIIPAAVLCLLYPLLGCMGLGEIIIAVIFSPLLYSGVYFVMKGAFSYEILILAASTGFLTAGVLFNHSILDYSFDAACRKITLSRLAGSRRNALIVLAVMCSCAYLNLLFWFLSGSLDAFYLLPFISLPFFIRLVKQMRAYIKENRSPESPEEFLHCFMAAQNLLKYFIIVLCISIILSNSL